MTGAKQCIVCLTEEEKIDLRGQKAGISLSLVKKEKKKMMMISIF